MDKQQYLSKLTKRIPIEKFPVVAEDLLDEWFRIEFFAPNEVIWYIHEDYTIYIINLDEDNPPSFINEIGFGWFNPIMGELIPIEEIPYEIAEDSLKALYPTNILPFLLMGIAILTIPLIIIKT